MAKQGRWILKNVRHNRPGVTIQGASVKWGGNTLNIGDITSKRREDINTGWYTDLGINLDPLSETMENIIKNGTNPLCGSTIECSGVTYRVNWILTQTPITPEPGYINISRNKIDALCENNSLFLITVNANVDWTVEVSQAAQSWLSVQDITNSGFKVKITDNHSEERTGYISVLSVGLDEGIGVDITVTQPFCDGTPVPTFNVDTTPITALCISNEPYWVSVTAENTDWEVEVTVGGEWISITNKANNGFNINIADSTTSQRNGTVRVKSTTPGVNITKDITISQPDCRPDEPSIDVNTSPINADCQGNQARTIAVTAKNTEWDVEVTQGNQWITISNKTANSFTVNIADSTTGQRTGKIEVKSTTPGVNIIKTITVTQPDCTPVPDSITVTPASWDIPCDVAPDTRYHFNINANVAWHFEGNVEATYDWIHIAETGATYFELKFDKNDAEDAADRSATITITGGTARATVSITQEKCEEVPPEPETLNITTNDFEVSCETDNTYTISVNASTAWTASTVYDWINITAITSNAIKITVSDNPGGERDGIISAYTTEGGAMAWDYITITQLECEEVETFDVDDADIRFVCNDDMRELEINATDGVSWTATASDNRFGLYLGSETPDQEVTGTGSKTLHIVTLLDNRNVRYDIQGTLRIQSSLGDDVTINLYQEPTPVLEYDGQTQFEFGMGGGNEPFTFKTNFDVNVTIQQNTNWLTYTKGNLGATADDGLQITFHANQNQTANPLSATITISSVYNGSCDKPADITLYIYQEAGIPPTPDAYFAVNELYGDFPYYAELGGYTHERSFMSEDYYDCCSDFDKGDIGGVVYLMPVRACAIQVYYDTNVDITGLTYEIEHISPANPAQEWLEVVMDPEEYGWSEVDSRDEPYPGDFILIKTRDRFDGTDLYEDTYTGYVHIKEKATGNILCSIPVKCIAVDIRGESVKVSATESTRDLEKNLKIGSESSPAVGAAGGFVDVWVYTNDSAYISDYIPGIFIADDNDVNWNKLTFYYPDDTRMPVVQAQDPMGYIDKIYDTTCNDNGLQLLRVYVAPNYSFNDAVTHGFHVRTENAGFEIFDGGNNAQVRIVQARDRVISESNYRIEEFFYTDNNMEPVFDGQGVDTSNITGGTCDGDSLVINPKVTITYDMVRASSPDRIQEAHPLNDGMIVYDETKQHNVVNPNVLSSAITYVNGSDWIQVNENYDAQSETPFEFYIRPNTGYTAGGQSRSAIITLTYTHGAPPRQFSITQSYKQVEPPELDVKLWAMDERGNRVGNDTEATLNVGSSNTFRFEILDGSNISATLTVTNGSTPGAGGPPPWLDEDVFYFSGRAKTYGTTATSMDSEDAIELGAYPGIDYPDTGTPGMGTYEVKTRGHSFDLHLICTSKQDTMIKKEMIIHVVQ